LRGVELLAQVLQEARKRGFADAYWPVIAKVIDRA